MLDCGMHMGYNDDVSLVAYYSAEMDTMRFCFTLVWFHSIMNNLHMAHMQNICTDVLKQAEAVQTLTLVLNK